MAGIMMLPSAATVAGPEPEIAAKKQQVMTPTIANPPVIWPTQTSANLIRRLETPAASISSPARIKKAIAISGKLSAPSTSCDARICVSNMSMWISSATPLMISA